MKYIYYINKLCQRVHLAKEIRKNINVYVYKNDLFCPLVEG